MTNYVYFCVYDLFRDMSGNKSLRVGDATCEVFRDQPITHFEQVKDLEHYLTGVTSQLRISQGFSGGVDHVTIKFYTLLRTEDDQTGQYLPATAVGTAHLPITHHQRLPAWLLGLAIGLSIAVYTCILAVVGYTTVASMPGYSQPTTTSTGFLTTILTSPASALLVGWWFTGLLMIAVCWLWFFVQREMKAR